ncbi:MAG TPA: hypothetical protein VH643_26345 [Gemmataceae bacterium]
MDTGELLTRWTVRLALALYALGLVLRWSARGRRSRLAAARLAWSAGCLAFLLHVLYAFQFYHHWSHADAYAVTAQRTAAVVGWDWGGGVYANYAFAVVWLADVVWWWRGLTSYAARPRSVEWSVQAFLAFMVFNAAVVFAEGVTRWVSLIVCLVLLTFRGWLALRSPTLRPLDADGQQQRRT